MNILSSRRSFLASAAAFSLAGCRSAFFDPLAGTPRLKFGVLSDIHITVPESTVVFLNALRYFRDNGVDAVLIAGDMADHGLMPQLQNVADAWFKVFPNDRAPDGRKVARLFVYGNHDPEGLHYRDKAMDTQFARHHLTYEEADKIQLSKIGLGKAWEQVFHEAYAPVYRKIVKGYDFIGGHWDPANGSAWGKGPDIRPMFQSLGGKLDPAQPFFYFQHPHPKDTVCGPWAWGHDAGISTQVLSNYPNAFAFSGHSHTTLTDEHSLWCGAFTSVGTASLSYTCVQGPRENRNELVTMAREGLETQAQVAQGQLVSVFEDRVVLERRDFVRNENLDEAWCVELPAESRPFSARAAKSVPPQFAAGAKVSVKRVRKDKKDVGTVQVAFPPAVADRRTRPYDYEIGVEFRQQDVERVHFARRVFSPTVALAKGRDAERREVVHAFAGKDFPEGAEYRVSVTPLNCWAQKGAPIATDWTRV